MHISIELLKEVINSKVQSIKEQLEGKTAPQIDKFEAIDKLGIISSIVIELHDKVEDDNLRDAIWELKKESDTLMEKLFSTPGF